MSKNIASLGTKNNAKARKAVSSSLTQSIIKMKIRILTHPNEIAYLQFLSLPMQDFEEQGV